MSLLFKLLLVAGILLLVVFIREWFKGRTLEIERKYKYTVKKQFLTREERELYDALVTASGTTHLVFAHVPLTTVLDYTTVGQDADDARAHIARKVLDFVLVARGDNTPKLAVELSHGEPDDAFEAIMKTANLPLLRLDNRNAFDVAALTRKVAELALK